MDRYYSSRKIDKKYLSLMLNDNDYSVRAEVIVRINHKYVKYMKKDEKLSIRNLVYKIIEKYGN